MLRGFSRHDGINDSIRSPKRLNCLSDLGLMYHGFTFDTTYILRPTIPSVSSFSPMRPHITLINWYRNINLFSIVYPSRTRLRSRLTLRWRTSRRKPWVFGEVDSHYFYRYSCLHAHFYPLQYSSSVYLQCWIERSPTTLKKSLKLRCNV
jgi:hypothetical protein